MQQPSIDKMLGFIANYKFFAWSNGIVMKYILIHSALQHRMIKIKANVFVDSRNRSKTIEIKISE